MSKSSVAQFDADLINLTAAMARIELLSDAELTDSDIERYSDMVEEKKALTAEKDAAELAMQEHKTRLRQTLDLGHELRQQDQGSIETGIAIAGRSEKL